MIKRYYRQNFSRLEDKRIVSGDSMEPEFHSGEIAWVSQQDTLCDGEIGIFGLNNEAYIKKLKRYADRLYLVSLNSKYSPYLVKSFFLENQGFFQYIINKYLRRRSHRNGHFSVSGTKIADFRYTK